MDLKKNGRILYISSVDVSLGNGPAVNELEFIMALHDALDGRAHFLIPQPEQPVADLPAEACTFVPSHRDHHLAHFAVHVMSQIRAAHRLLSGCRFDLLVFRLDLAPFVPFAITRRHQVPYAVKTLGATTLNVLERVPWPGRWLTLLNSRLFRRIVADAVVADAASRLHVQSLRKALGVGPDQVVWIDNSVNTRRFFPTAAIDARRELGLERFDPIAGYVGNLPHERGGAQLIETMPRLLARYPRLGILVVGGGNGLDKLIHRANELGVQAHCIFPGHVPFERIHSYVNALDVGVSFLPPKSHAASEQKVRQYVACGKPVIATTPGGNDFLVRENLGSLVPYDDLDAIVAELDRWLSLTGEERMAFTSRAFRYACEHLSVDHAIAKRIALWDEQLGCRSENRKRLDEQHTFN